MKWLSILLLSGTMLAATTHYISTSGLDTNTGTSTSTPWAHLPGMVGCSNNCSAYTPVAGDHFILRGGDTWGSTSAGINWTWSGTSIAPIYIGVDQTYFTGASWTRPKFDCQLTSCPNNGGFAEIWIAGDWITLDNIELTGYRQCVSGDTNCANPGGLNLVAVFDTNDEVENMYIHGFSRSTASSTVNSNAISMNFSSGGGAGSKFHDNVIDGSDSPNQDFMGGIIHGEQVYDNVIRYVYNGMNGIFNQVYGNLIEFNYVSTSGDHCNMMFVQGPVSGSSIWVYNNIVRHAGCSGGSTMWMNGNTTCVGCVSYAYNNVIYDTAGDFDAGITIGGHPASGNTGTYNLYNNTIDAGGGLSCTGNGESSPRSTTNLENNHCINATELCNPSGTTCNSIATNLSQTEAVANGQGYTSTETYAYSPANNTGSTVGAGTNLSSACAGNLVALCSDTSYATYNTINHTVVMRATNVRGSTWDIGAYQFTSVPSQLNHAHAPGMFAELQ